MKLKHNMLLDGKKVDDLGIFDYLERAYDCKNLDEVDVVCQDFVEDLCSCDVSSEYIENSEQKIGKVSEITNLVVGMPLGDGIDVLCKSLTAVIFFNVRDNVFRRKTTNAVAEYIVSIIEDAIKAGVDYE